jgi:hypothetical protein
MKTTTKYRALLVAGMLVVGALSISLNTPRSAFWGVADNKANRDTLTEWLGILHQYGGFVKVETGPQHGTAITVFSRSPTNRRS